MAGVQLIVGLGNPGPQYEDTRHNAGFWLIDALPASRDANWRNDTRFQALLCQVTLGGHDCRLLKPTTFMNRSGQAIGAVSRYFRILPSEILVVHDELDLPPGTVRLKRGGGDGGHNGLRDTIAQLGSRDFLRLRIGIGHPGHSGQVIGYVLRPPPVDERAGILASIDAAVDVLPLVLAGELEKAMHRLHSRPTPP